MYRIGFDIGGSKIECCVLGNSNTVLYRGRLPTGNVFDGLRTLYNTALLHAPGPHSVGIGMPGSISKSTSLLKNCSIASINNTDFVSGVKESLGVDAQFANDSQCFAIAEALDGAGRGHTTVLGIILGTGVGGGIVVDGKLQSGLHGISGEWGHTHLDASNNIRCRCGRVGCVETWISGSGVAQWGNALLGTSDLTSAQCMEHHVVREIFTARFGSAIANMIQIIDPDCVVIGGGLSALPWIYTDGVASIRKHIFNDELLTPILQAELGPSAGVIGAALL